MRLPHYIVIALIIISAGIFLLIANNNQKSIHFLSGAGMKVPVMEIAKNFEKETGIKVKTDFEGSSILRDYIIKYKRGDLFLPGDKKNLDIISEKGLLEDSFFLAWHVVSILVAPEMKDRIRCLNDLADKGIRLVISNPRQASLGKIVMKHIIERHPKGRQILNNVVVYGSSSQDVLRIYREGGVDAVIEWDVMASTPEGKGLIIVPIEDDYQVKDQLFVGLLRTSKDQVSARKFYDYMKTKGKEVFRKHGYNITFDKKGQSSACPK